MQLREHLVAVVEPNEAGERSLDIATDLVASGGRATLVVLINQQVRNEFRQFADAEDLDVHVGEAIALNRLLEAYTSRVGGHDTEAIVADSTSSARDLLDVAAGTHATSIAIPQQIAARRRLRKLVSAAHIPVLVTAAA
jgi:hypothetical protein